MSLVNKFQTGPAWRLCLRHEWAGWMMDIDPCPGCEVDPSPPSIPCRVTEIDYETGTVTISEVN